MTIFDAISILLAAFALHLIRELGNQVKALEARQPEKRVQALAQVVQPIQEKPKAGTVAAKAAKPVVFLGHVPHRAIELDNGCLEWEGKS